MKFVRLSLILLLGLWGCLTEPDCFDTSANLCTFAFFNASNNPADVQVDSIAISGLPQLLIPTPTTFRQIALPFNPAEPGVTVTFYFGNVPQTVSLRYQLKTEVVSQDCGALAYISDLSLVDSSFDNITVLNKQLATNAGTNVKVVIQ
ncbi:MAG: hypothetical protein KF856_08320 [Cyclobacteriaceae bacterium]|nr:hypothetical protein [Cyclobacteriaceae bacterium]